MKKRIILASVIVSILFVSCKKDEEVKSVEETQQPAQTFSGEAWLKQRVGGQGQTVQQPVQQQVQTQSQSQTQTAPGMNPPHGQPGHRCEIPVGAPLNSKPDSKTTQVVNSKPVEQPVLKVNSNSGSGTVVGSMTPPGMNPPHGQEGHRCDIAVGAPLPKE